jgi:uncharacterized membrane protein YsdA (DUF1294 family)
MALGLVARLFVSLACLALVSLDDHERRDELRRRPERRVKCFSLLFESTASTSDGDLLELKMKRLVVDVDVIMNFVLVSLAGVLIVVIVLVMVDQIVR